MHQPANGGQKKFCTLGLVTGLAPLYFTYSISSKSVKRFALGNNEKTSR